MKFDLSQGNFMRFDSFDSKLRKDFKQRTIIIQRVLAFRFHCRPIIPCVSLRHEFNREHGFKQGLDKL